MTPIDGKAGAAVRVIRHMISVAPQPLVLSSVSDLPCRLPSRPWTRRHRTPRPDPGAGFDNSFHRCVGGVMDDCAGRSAATLDVRETVKTLSDS